MRSELRLFDEDRHPEALELLSIEALSEGNLAQAFKFADRRCRIDPPAKAHHFALRSEISHRMGHVEMALTDIDQALELAPDDLGANRRMLAWGRGRARTGAARRLLRLERDMARVAMALRALQSAGESAFAALVWTDTTISGWAVWNRSAQARISIENGNDVVSTTLEPDPRHPLASKTSKATNFILRRPRSAVAQRITAHSGKTLIYQTRLRPNEPAPRLLPRIAKQTVAPTERISIIVPVYADFAATKACLHSVMRELQLQRNAQLVLIDDASPDTQIKRLLRQFAHKPRVRLLTNDHNLGFANAINRGLDEIGCSDVILLNADTIVPPGFIARLRAAAYRSPDIGTVTPLSNNGELTSFPVAFRANPLPSGATICEIDDDAAAANSNGTIDMPNGVGFCLYVTGICMAAVGRLSDAFHRGYFEDVDLCLRARELGFRNVCATSVYVGHAGSRSFADEKHALVMRNLETIEQCYPKYRPECAAFLQADPLRPAREAIERCMPAANNGASLLVTGPGLIKAVAQARAEDLLQRGERTLIAEFHFAARGLSLSIVNPAKGTPQSLSFGLSTPAERATALNYLRDVAPARIEITDVRVPDALIDLIRELNCPIDLFVADAGLVCPRGNLLRPDGSICDALSTLRPCRECSAGATSEVKRHGTMVHARGRSWHDLFVLVRHIYAPDVHAGCFASRILAPRKVAVLRARKGAGKTEREKLFRDSAVGQAIGLSVAGAGVIEYQLLKEIAETLGRELPERSIIVIGSTLDDIGLMKLDNVHVTGDVTPNEYNRVFRQYAISALIFAVRQPLFGHPVISGLLDRVPTASFDWSLGQIPPGAGDLALSPYLTRDELLTSLLNWLRGI